MQTRVPYAYEMKEEYLKELLISTAAMIKKQKLEETAKQKAIYEEQLEAGRRSRDSNESQEEAKKVASAGESTEKHQDAKRTGRSSRT